MNSTPLMLLVLLCFFAGSRWLLPESDADALTSLVSLTFGAGLSLLCASLLVAKRRKHIAATASGRLALLVSGVGVVGGPALLLLLGRQRLSSVMAVAIQAGVPVVVAVASGATDANSELQKKLLPGVLALAGVLLVLPVGLPHSGSGWIGFILYVAAAALSGIASVFCYREMIRFRGGEAIVLVTGANAVFLAVLASVWLTVSSQWHLLSAIRVPQLLLSSLWLAISILGVVALLRLLPPLAMASRFVLIPLIATVQAYVLLRPTLSFRSACGVLLMLIGGIACLRAESAESLPGDTSLS